MRTWMALFFAAATVLAACGETEPDALAGSVEAKAVTTTLEGSNTTVGPRLSPTLGAAPPPVIPTTAALTTAAPTTAATDCHPAYGGCLQNLAGDALNCGDIPASQKPVTVKDVNVDPYKLDGNDRDGRACES